MSDKELIDKLLFNNNCVSIKNIVLAYVSIRKYVNVTNKDELDKFMLSFILTLSDVEDGAGGNVDA